MEKQEQIILKMHPHWLGFLNYYFFGIIVAVLGIFFAIIFSKMAVVGIIAIVVGILAMGLGELVRRAETFYLLENGVAKEYKFLSTSRKFVEYENIQNIEMNQSVLQNILGIGNLRFDTSGSDEVEVSFRDVKKPHQLEKIIREKMKAK